MDNIREIDMHVLYVEVSLFKGFSKCTNRPNQFSGGTITDTM